MDQIIESISEIENDSVKIMEEANAKKSKIFAQIKLETKAYDTELEIRTAARIEELKLRMEKDMEKQLAHQQTLAAEYLKNLEQHYESRRSFYVNQLFKEMTGV